MLGSFAALASFLVVVFLGVLIYGVTIAAPNDQQRAARAALDENRSAAQGGQVLYEGRCAQCHGRRGQGGAGPSFEGIRQTYPDVTEHEAIVRDGKGRMPAFGDMLTPEQISAVVAYEREVLDQS